MNKWYSIAAGKAPKSAVINIFGDIGYGYSASDFQGEFDKIGQVDQIDLHLNTPGGDVFTGNAIYNILARSKAKKVVTIEGLAASMGSVIAMVGDEIIMPQNAMLMIHNPVGGISGNVDEIKSFADALSNMELGIVKAYVDRTGMAEAKVRALMDKETWLSAEAAVQMGFATKVEKPVKMAAMAGALGRFKNAPKDFGVTDFNPEPQEVDTMKADDIKQMCALAGKPGLADALITAKAELPAVMAAIDAAQKADKATADAAAAAAAGKVDESAVRTKVLAEVSEVKSLCNLAGFGDKADGFITAGKSVSDVITALDALKKEAATAAAAKGKGAKKSEAATGGEVSARQNHRPEGNGVKTIDANAIWDKHNGRKTA
jgi:ATP-dependent Clp protease protease subunit